MKFQKFGYLLSFASTCCITSATQPATPPSPPPPHDSWESYLTDSEQAERRRAATLTELKSAAGGGPLGNPPLGKRTPEAESLPDAWFQSEQGRLAADAVISFQCPNGGWSKNFDCVSAPRAPLMAYGASEKWTSTFDNASTIPQIRLLARSYRLGGGPEKAHSVYRGLDYILRSQYPNGGWPQIYPLAGGYHDHITYNDDAFVSIMELLLDIELAHEDFAWISLPYRERCNEALERGLACLLKTQIRTNGRLTGWAQQHDRMTLDPAPARAFEMRSLASKETASILDFLIRLPEPNPEIVASIQAAASWLRETAISGYDFAKGENGVRQLIPNPEARDLWARFYEIGANRPLFGDRDGSVHYTIENISVERRNGYAWYTHDPASTLNRIGKWEARRGEGSS